MKDHGINSVICNRSDGKMVGQPAWVDVKAAAIAAGLQVHHIPITPGALGLAGIQAHEEAVTNLPGPILAYCNSGTCAAALYEIASDSGS